MDSCISLLLGDSSPAVLLLSPLRKSRRSRLTSPAKGAPSRDEEFCYDHPTKPTKSTRWQSLFGSKSNNSFDDSDDETASTSVSSMDETKSVTFSDEVVTYTRPYTTRSERALLYYSDLDYQAFKYAWIRGIQDDERPAKAGTRRVSFDRTPTKIHLVPAHPKRDHEDLYYSESELQGFLDDFVMSLNQRASR